MAVSLKHKRQIGVADSTDPKDSNKVKPSNWNDEHDLNLSSGNVLGRKSVGPGPAEELGSGDIAALLNGAFQPHSSNLDDWSGKAAPASQILPSASSRTALAAADTGNNPAVYLREAGREGAFVWDSSNLSSKVTVDTVQGLYVAPASDTTGAHGAWIRKYDGPLQAKWFGAKGDNSTDNTTPIVKAVAELDPSGAELCFDGGIYLMNPDAFALGNGSDSAISTLNNIALLGKGSSPYLPTVGTVIKANTTGTSLLALKGSLHGCRVYNIGFDCDGKVDNAFDVYSLNDSHLRGFWLKNFKQYGFKGQCRAMGAASVAWSANNVIEMFQITSSVVVDFGAGMFFDGYFTNNYDWYRDNFRTGIVEINGGVTNPTYAAHFKFSDSCVFDNVDFNVVGGTGYSRRFDGTSNAHYPQNHLFQQCSCPRGDLVTGTIDANYHTQYPTKDSEPIPTDPNLIGFTDQGQFFGYHQIANFGAGSMRFTTATTEAIGDTDGGLRCNAASTMTVTLPTVSSTSRRTLRFKNLSGQAVNSASSNVVPIGGGSAGTAILSASAGKWCQMQWSGSSWDVFAAN